MSSVPIHLPLKASEAAALADVICQCTDHRVITHELRRELSERIAELGLESVVPFPGSLQTDPVHPGTCYLAVDCRIPAEKTSFLVRVSLSTTQGSSLFADPIAIGRMRPGGAREVIVHAIPFGPDDEQNILTFAERVDPSFLPRRMGAQRAITIVHCDAGDPAQAAFQAFHLVYRDFGMNLAAYTGPAAPIVWAAIRSGWRLGYALEPATRLVVNASDLPNVDWNLDVEVSLRDEAEATSPHRIGAVVRELRGTGHTAQFIAPKLGGATLEALTSAARECNVILSLYESEVLPQQLRGLGAVNYKIKAEGADLKDRVISAAEHLQA